MTFIFSESFVGKTVGHIDVHERHGLETKSLASAVLIWFTDGSKLVVSPYNANHVELELIESTLTNNVIPIGTNSLGEGSV